LSTLTVFPDPGNPGTTSCDGDVGVNSNFSYATAHSTADEINCSGVGVITCENSANDLGSGPQYSVIRLLINFDTSALGSSAVISAATISVKVQASHIAFNTGDTIRLVPNTISSHVAYAISDFGSIGTTAQSATELDIDTMISNTYQSFLLNSTGRGNINKTGVSHFGMRSVLDISNTQPTLGTDPTFPTRGGSVTFFNSADVSGTSSDPKIVITYTAPIVLTVPVINRAFVAIAPTRVLGARVLTVPVINRAFAAIAPTRVLSPSVKTVPVITAHAAGVAPSRLVSALSRAAGVIAVAAAVTAPARAVGAVTRAVPAIGVSIAASAPARTFGVASKTVPAIGVSIAASATGLRRSLAAPVVSVAVVVVAPSRSTTAISRSVPVITVGNSAIPPARTVSALSRTVPVIGVSVAVVAPARVLSTIVRTIIGSGSSGSQGPIGAASAADDSGVGSVTWSSLANITAQDGADCIAAGNFPPITTHYLAVSFSGFSIPGGAGILGVGFRVHRRFRDLNAGGMFGVDNSVRIIKTDGTKGSSNLADAVTHWSTYPTYEDKVYGGASELWGWTPTAANINAGFGFAISGFSADDSEDDIRFQIDYVEATVYYSSFSEQFAVTVAASAPARIIGVTNVKAVPVVTVGNLVSAPARSVTAISRTVPVITVSIGVLAPAASPPAMFRTPGVISVSISAAAPVRIVAGATVSMPAAVVHSVTVAPVAAAVGGISRAVPSAALAVTVSAPARVLSGLTRSVPVISVAASLSAPARVVGAISRTAPVVNVAASAVAPVVALGFASKTVAAVSLAVTVGSPGRAVGAISKSVPAIAVAVSAVTPGVIHGTATKVVPASSVAIAVLAPGRSVGAVSRSVPVISVQAAVLAPASVRSFVAGSAAVGVVVAGPGVSLQGTIVRSVPVATVSITSIGPAPVHSPTDLPEFRTVFVTAESRVTIVDAESRTVTVNAESRLIEVL